MANPPESAGAPVDDETILSRAPLVIRRTVKWGETDAAGVVYTPRFLDYAVEAAETLFQALTGEHWSGFSRPRGIELPAIGAKLRFRHALWPADRLDLTVLVTRVGASSHTVRVRGDNQDGVHCFDAEVTFVAIESGARKPVAMPGELAERLHAYRAACDGAGREG